MDFLAGFLTRNGLRLRGHVEGRAGRAALLIHGLGDHARAKPYLRLRAALVEGGWRVYSFDLPGHGLSEGERIYTRAWRCLGDDVNDVIEVAAERENRAIFVLGMSMGGLLALHAALQARRGSAVDSSPDASMDCALCSCDALAYGSEVEANLTRRRGRRRILAR